MENQNKLRPRYDPAENSGEKFIFVTFCSDTVIIISSSLSFITKAKLSVPIRNFLLRFAILLLLWSRLV